jgi:hypothetical protein
MSAVDEGEASLEQWLDHNNVGCFLDLLKQADIHSVAELLNTIRDRGQLNEILVYGNQKLAEASWIDLGSPVLTIRLMNAITDRAKSGSTEQRQEWEHRQCQEWEHRQRQE